MVNVILCQLDHIWISRDIRAAIRNCVKQEYREVVYSPLKEMSRTELSELLKMPYDSPMAKITYSQHCQKHHLYNLYRSFFLHDATKTKEYTLTPNPNSITIARDTYTAPAAMLLFVIADRLITVSGIYPEDSKEIFYLRSLRHMLACAINGYLCFLTKLHVEKNRVLGIETINGVPSVFVIGHSPTDAVRDLVASIFPSDKMTYFYHRPGFLGLNYYAVKQNI